MGIQEIIIGLSVLVLLAALVYGATRASGWRRRRRHLAVGDEAARRNFGSCAEGQRDG